MDHMDENIDLKVRLADLSCNFDSGHLPTIYDGVYLCLEALGSGDFFENLKFKDPQYRSVFNVDSVYKRNLIISVNESLKPENFKNGSYNYFIIGCRENKPLVFEKSFNFRPGQRGVLFMI